MKNWMFTLLLLAAFGLQAQPSSNKEARMERMESARIAFLTNQLDLTPAEAEKFWPVYNEMRSKIKALMAERREANRNMLENNDLVPADREELLLENYRRDLVLANLRLEYHDKFKAILGLEKTLSLAKAEHDFHRKMMERMGDRDRKGPMQRRGKD
jgi:Spy/CpxP family protein refolding chaperone